MRAEFIFYLKTMYKNKIVLFKTPIDHHVHDMLLNNYIPSLTSIKKCVTQYGYMPRTYLYKINKLLL